MGSKSIAEFAEQYGVSKMTVNRLIKAKKLRAVKLGTRTLILDEDDRAFRASLPPVHETTA